MIVGHRWKRQHDLMGYKCVGLPIGGVESGRWCVGCDCFIGDIDIYNSPLKCLFDESKELALDAIAGRDGFPPIEHGTLKWIVFKGRKQSALK